MRALLAIFTITLFTYLSSSTTLAQVVINEISPTGETEWVELFNTSTEEISLEGWEVADNQTGQYHFGITLHTPIAPNGFVIVESPKGKLTDSGDTLTLYNQENKSIDGPISYEETKKPKTHSRIPDGSGLFLANTDPTPNDFNQAPTSEPTPAPTSTPDLTNTPTPTSKKPTKTPTPLRTPTTTSTLTIESETEVATDESDYPKLILGESTTPEPTQESEEEQDSDPPNKNFPILLTITGIAIFGSSAGYLAYTHYLKPKRSKIPRSDPQNN